MIIHISYITHGNARTYNKVCFKNLLSDIEHIVIIQKKKMEEENFLQIF